MRKGSRSFRWMGLILVLAVGLMAPAFADPALAAAKTPSQVTGVGIGSVKTTSFKITWNKAKNGKKYQVQWKRASAKKWTAPGKTLSSRSFTLQKLAAGTKYQVRVRAVNGTKKGKWSKIAAKTTLTVPAKVTGVRISNVKTSSFKVTWNKAKYAAKYEIQLKRAGAASWPSKSFTAKTNAFTYEKLGSGVKYQVRVRGVNGTRKGPWSALATGTTKQIVPPDAPRSVYTAASYNSSMVLKWDEVDGATGYHVLVRINDSPADTVLDKTVTSNTVEVDGLCNETSYIVNVWALKDKTPSKTCAEAFLRTGNDLVDTGYMRYETYWFKQYGDEDRFPKIYYSDPLYPNDAGMIFPNIYTDNFEIIGGTLEQYDAGENLSREIGNTILKVGDEFTTLSEETGTIKSIELRVQTDSASDPEDPEISGYLMWMTVSVPVELEDGRTEMVDRYVNMEWTL